MPSNSEALCLFLNRLGSRIPDDGSGSATVHQHRSLPNEIAGGSGEQQLEHYYSFPSLALFKAQPAGATTASEKTSGERMERYDFGTTNEEMKKKSESGGGTGAAAASWPKETALRNLSAPIRYRGASELRRAPSELANRALDSFAFLVAANLRQFFRIQLRRHAREGELDAKAKDLASFFLDGTTTGGGGGDVERQREEEGKPIDIAGASTSFHLEEGEEREDSSGGELGAADGPRRITFHMNVELCVLGRKMSIPIKTVGELKASFETAAADDSNHITGATVTLETNQLLLSMRTQARLVVLKAVAKKGFPVIHTDAPATIIPPRTAAATSTSEHARRKESDGGKVAAPAAPPPPAGDKMKKLALCASLELASVINDSSPLLSQRGAKEDAAQKKQRGSAKRRLSAAMGAGAGALFVLPGKRPAVSSAAPHPPHKLAGASKNSLPPLGQVVSPLSAMGRLVHQT